jgi:hypothetical protein
MTTRQEMRRLRRLQAKGNLSFSLDNEDGIQSKATLHQTLEVVPP